MEEMEEEEEEVVTQMREGDHLLFLMRMKRKKEIPQLL
jgi:hypothetical protein